MTTATAPTVKWYRVELWPLPARSGQARGAQTRRATRSDIAARDACRSFGVDMSELTEVSAVEIPRPRGSYHMQRTLTRTEFTDRWDHPDADAHREHTDGLDRHDAYIDVERAWQAYVADPAQWHRAAEDARAELLREGADPAAADDASVLIYAFILADGPWWVDRDTEEK